MRWKRFHSYQNSNSSLSILPIEKVNLKQDHTSNSIAKGAPRRSTLNGQVAEQQLLLLILCFFENLWFEGEGQYVISNWVIFTDSKKNSGDRGATIPIAVAAPATISKHPTMTAIAMQLVGLWMEVFEFVYILRQTCCLVRPSCFSSANAIWLLEKRCLIDVWTCDLEINVYCWSTMREYEWKLLCFF